MSVKFGFGGIPTDIDVRRLQEKFGVPQPGESISYALISEVLGNSRTESRFWVVTGAWRRQLFRENNLVTEAIRNEGLSAQLQAAAPARLGPQTVDSDFPFGDDAPALARRHSAPLQLDSGSEKTQPVGRPADDFEIVNADLVTLYPHQWAIVAAVRGRLDPKALDGNERRVHQLDASANHGQARALAAYDDRTLGRAAQASQHKVLRRRMSRSVDLDDCPRRDGRDRLGRRNRDGRRRKRTVRLAVCQKNEEHHRAGRRHVGFSGHDSLRGCPNGLRDLGRISTVPECEPTVLLKQGVLQPRPLMDNGLDHDQDVLRRHVGHDLLRWVDQQPAACANRVDDFGGVPAHFVGRSVRWDRLGVDAESFSPRL